jgi:hypothetical protein
MHKKSRTDKVWAGAGIAAATRVSTNSVCIRRRRNDFMGFLRMQSSHTMLEQISGADPNRQPRRRVFILISPVSLLNKLS